MTRGRGRGPRRGPTRCDGDAGCGAVVRWAAAASNTRIRRKYDPKPLTPQELAIGAVAAPFYGGQAWNPTELATHFMHIRGCSRADAVAEVNDLAWHRLHHCSTSDAAAPTRTEDQED